MPEVLALENYRVSTSREGQGRRRAIHAEIAALEQRLEKTKAIKQGMMQKLLTGRIRLVDPSTPVEASA